MMMVQDIIKHIVIFFVYGGYGLKSDFGGHDNHHYNNLYAYLGAYCFDDGTDQLPGHNDYYYNNTCVQANNLTNYGDLDCTQQMNAWPIVGNNSIFAPDGSKGFIGLCDIPEAQLQKMGYDLGTVIQSLPSDSYILNMARVLLGL